VSCTEIIVVGPLIDEMVTAAIAVFTVITPFMFTMATMIVVFVAAAVTLVDTPTTMIMIAGTADMAHVQVATMLEEAVPVMNHAMMKGHAFS
jgi:ketopantoate hydroxymethyltransferase